MVVQNSAYGYERHIWMKPGVPQHQGLRLLYERHVITTEIAGKKCVATDSQKGNNFIVFDVDDSFILNGSSTEAVLTVEYLDRGEDTFAIQYDSSHIWPRDVGFARAGRIVKKHNTNTWKTYTARLRNIQFSNRQGYGPARSSLMSAGGGDFRINSRGDGDEYVSHVTVTVPFITETVNDVGNIFDMTDDVAVSINIDNRRDTDLFAALTYTVTDYGGMVVASREQKIHVPKRTVTPQKLGIEPDAYGIFYVDIALKENNKLIEAYRTSIAVCAGPPHLTPAQSPFGVTLLLDYGATDQVITILKRLGIDWVRYDFRPLYVETTDGSFNWANYDTIVKKFYANDIHACAILLDSRHPDITTGSTAAIDDYSRFAALVVQRYKDYIKHWEVWNEPDLWGFWPSGPDAKNYTKLLKACSQTIKAVDPGAHVLVGGLGGRPNHRFWFLDHIYAHKGGPHFDIVAVHPYTIPAPPEQDDALERKLLDLVSRMKLQGDTNKQIHLTEIGWSTSRNGVSLKEQAQFLVRTYVIALSQEAVGRVFWHEFRNLGMDVDAIQQHFGLLHDDFIPKPAAVAYLNLIRQIGGLKYRGRLSLDDTVRGYVFGNEHKSVQVLWSLGGTNVVNIPVASTNAVVTDIMGNTSQLQAREGTLAVLVTQSPVFLVENVVKKDTQ
jgi:hypothetical protein